MSLLVCSGAGTQCTMGLAPATLMVLPLSGVSSGGGPPAAHIGDHLPLVNMLPFGLCRSPANPVVAAATAAASGTLTPMPCIPNTPAPWSPGATTVLLGGQPALSQASQLSCLWAGTISITNAGQTNTSVP